jgi:hypothetical protein
VVNPPATAAVWLALCEIQQRADTKPDQHGIAQTRGGLSRLGDRPAVKCGNGGRVTRKAIWRVRIQVEEVGSEVQCGRSNHQQPVYRLK